MSYNSLFGLGPNAEDASLEGYWLLQDDAASTSIADSSSNARTGVLVNAGNTEDIAVAGPNSWLPSALSLDGTDDYIDCDTSVTGDETILIWAKTTVTGDRHIVSTGNASNNTLFTRIQPTSASTGRYWARFAGEGIINQVAGSALTNWHFYASQVEVGSQVRLSMDGAAFSTNAYTPSAFTRNKLAVGVLRRSTVSGFTPVVAAGVANFSRVLTITEVNEVKDGPEPINTVPGTLGSDGAVDVGSWDSQSNGTITYEWIVANAAGTVVDSGTGSTGTADLSSEAGNTCYLLVRATNNGGYDVGDFATRTSGYGSSGDGYYELDSVVADGGGGGVTGVAAITEGADTLSSVSLLDLVAASGITEDNDSVSSSSTISIAASLAVNEADDTSSATAVLQIVGTLATTEEADTATGTATLAAVGELTATEEDDSLTASGSSVAVIVGELTVTESDDSVSSTSQLLAEAVSAILEESDTVSAASIIAIAGVAGLNEDADTLSSTATLPIVGVVSLSDGDDSLAAFQSTGSLVLQYFYYLGS